MLLELDCSRQPREPDQIRSDMPKAHATRNTTNQDKYEHLHGIFKSEGQTRSSVLLMAAIKQQGSVGEIERPAFSSPLLSSPLQNQEFGRSNPRTRKLMKYPRRGPPATFPAPGSKSVGTRERQIKARLRL